MFPTSTILIELSINWNPEKQHLPQEKKQAIPQNK